VFKTEDGLQALDSPFVREAFERTTNKELLLPADLSSPFETAFAGEHPPSDRDDEFGDVQSWQEPEALTKCRHCWQRLQKEAEEPEFEYDLSSAPRDFSLKDIADKNNLPDAIRTDILRDGKTDVSDLANRAFWDRHTDMAGQQLDKTGSKHAKLRAEWGIIAQKVKALIWLRQVIDELDKTRGEIPRDFLLGWMAVESDGRVSVVTSRPERGYFQIDWKGGEAREQLGLSETQFKKLSTDRVFSIEKGIELAQKYRQWVLTNHPAVLDKSELLWRLTKGRHAASGTLKDVLDGLVRRKTNITWAAVSQLIPGFMRRNIDAALDYAAKLQPFANLVGAAAPSPTPAPGRAQPELYDEFAPWLEETYEEFTEEAFEEEHREQSEEEEEFEEVELVSEHEGISPGLAYETLPPEAEEGEHLEEYDTDGAKGLVLLDHMHVPKAPDPAHPGTFKVGSLTALKTADLNPGFIDASDRLITDASPTGLQTCLQVLISTSFQDLLGGTGRTAASFGDRVHVGLVDLTGAKLTAPDFASWGSTVHIHGASVPKILALYAACQLRSDLRELASRKSPKNGLELEKLAIAELKAKGLTKLLPDFVWLFDIRKWKPSATLVFTASARDAFANIRHNCPAGTLIVKVGLPYIGSLAWQSGLYHPQRNGLWLKAAYCGKGRWASPVAAPESATATALSAATYFTLLAQGRLVDDASSGEIRTALRSGCITSLFPSLPVVASKCGILHEYIHDCAWIEDADVRYVMVVMSRLKTKRHTELYTQLCGELDTLIRSNNRTPKSPCR
jgi:hypothetical protein